MLKYKTIFDELSKYETNGYFVLTKDQKLSKECNAPEQPGVYCIFKVWKGEKKLVYIGSSGTRNQKEGFKNQLLHKRLVKGKQEKKILRQKFFANYFLTNDIEKFEIYWFVTFDENSKHLPKYVEGVLLQKFFESNGCLPLWNKCF